MANEFKIKKGLIVTGASGGTVVDIQGSQGQLFSVTDDLSGSIFAVSDISGVPIFDVNSSGISYFDGSLGIGTSSPGKKLEVKSDITYDGIQISGSSIPTLAIIDTTNNAKLVAYARDSDATIGTETNHILTINTNNTTALTLDTSQNATFAGNVTSELNITAGSYSRVAQTTVSILSDAQQNSVLKFREDSDNYGFTLGYYGSPNNFVLTRHDNSATGDTVMSIPRNSSAVTFSTQAFATTATSSGDASSTLTTKGYVDSLITGATIYRGTWDPDVSLNSGYGNPNLNTVTQTSGYYYICSADGAATPNGATTEPNSWNTGDWVIWNDDIGASGEWQKIDNSSVLSGVGTGQTVALWEGASSVTDSETLGNAPITVSGNNSTFAGTISSGAITSTANISGVNLIASTAVYSGGIFYGSSTLSLKKSNGNSYVDFDTNLNATFAGTISSGAINSTGNVRAEDMLAIYDSTKVLQLKNVNNEFSIRNGNSGLVPLTINSSGNATFAGNVALTGDLRVTADASTADIVAQWADSNGNNTATFRTTTPGQIFEIRSQNNGTLKFDSTISWYTGKIGIGTNGPVADLQVLSTKDGMTNGLNTNQLKLSYGASVVGAGSSVAFGVSSNNNFTGAKIVHERTASNSVGDLTFWTRQTGGTSTDYDLTIERMRIKSDGNIQLNAYGAGTLVTDASGNITASSGGGAGGPYLPLSAGPSYPLTGDLYQTMGAIGVAQTDQDYLAKIYESNADGFMSLYTGQPTPLERIRISSYGDSFFVPANNGNIGIGVTGPTKTLHVVSAAEAALFQGTATWGTGIQIDATATGGRNFQIQSSADAAGEGGGKFLIVDRDATGGPTRIAIDSTGNVGIGTTSPSRKVQIDGGSSDGAIQFTNTVTGSTASDGTYVGHAGTGTDFQIWNYENGYIRFGTNGAERMRIDASGNSLFYGPAYIMSGQKLYLNNSVNTASGSIVCPGGGSLALQSYGNNMIYLYENSEIRFSTNTSQKMVILQGGNVGINTTSPDFKLDVEGTLGVSDLPFNASSTSVLVANETLSAELVTNGDFDTNTNWANQSGTNWSISGGKASVSNSASVRYFQQSGVLPNPSVNKSFLIKWTISGLTQGGIGINVGGYITTTIQTSNGTYEQEVTPTNASSNTILYLQSNANTIGSVDNVSVKEITSASTQIQKRSLGSGAFSDELWAVTLTDSNNIYNLNSGNVGIGTTTPLAKLDIQGTQGQLFSVTDDLSGSIFAVSDISGVPIFDVNSSGVSYFDGNVGIGTTSPGAKLVVSDGTQAFSVNPHSTGIDLHSTGNLAPHYQTDFTLYTGAIGSGSARVTVNSAGNVGIGITNPAVPLDVEGKIRSNDSNSGDYLEIFCDGSVSGDSYIENTNNNIQIKSAFATSFSTSGSVAMFIKNNQNVGIGTITPGAKLDVAGIIFAGDGNKATPGYSFASDPDTGMFRDSANVLTFGVGADRRMSISNTVISTALPLGVNTTGVTSGIKLQVQGNVLFGSSGVGDFYLGNYATANHFRFHTNNANTYFDMNCGDIYWRQGTSTRYQFFPSTANMTVQGTITQNSDARIKENVVEISDCISKVQAMRGVYYNRTDFNTEVTKVGVIAQEVEAVLPELVLESPETGLKSVAYSELTSVLINAIKEQQEIIENLKTRITKLEN